MHQDIGLPEMGARFIFGIFATYAKRADTGRRQRCGCNIFISNRL